MKTNRTMLNMTRSLSAMALSLTSLSTLRAAQQPAASPMRPPDSTTAPATDNSPATSAQAPQDPPADSSTAAANRTRDAVKVAPGDAADRSARHYANEHVRDAEGKELGTVQDFAVDPNSGEIAFLVIAPATEDTLVLIPWAAVNAPANAAGFTTKSGGAAAARSAQLARQDYNAGKIKSATGAPLARASALRGKQLRANGHDAGTVEELFVDLDTGVVAAVVDPPAEFTQADAKFLVPLGRLALEDPQPDVIIATIAPAEFGQAQSDGKAVASTRGSQSPGAQDESALSPTGRTKPDSPSAPGEPSVLSAADAVRQVFANDPALAEATIQITQENSRLVLRGKVSDGKTKANIERAARQAASGTPVDSQITVEKP